MIPLWKERKKIRYWRRL